PNQPRRYKTRVSPIDAVWDNELEGMLRENPDLQSKTLFLHLQRTHINDAGEPVYTSSIERTLQRKVARWLALNGKPKEMMFPQEHIPGHQALSDFTHFDKANVTINGEPFQHMFYHFRLVYSKWSYLKVIRSGESMQALSEGLQEALFTLGGAPKEHRTDSLSAAFKNLSLDIKKDLTDNYEALCAYYNMTPTRNNKGKKHENGSVESSHGHLKNRILQELLLRGNRDFLSIEAYECWVHDIVTSSNKRNCCDFSTEKLALQLLPNYKTADYEVKSAKVTRFCIVTLKGLRYSVPSQLSGHTVTLHVYQHQIKAYLGNSLVFSFERKYLADRQSQYVINYKHIIHALIKKPGAFRYCQYRDSIFPNDHYRDIWNVLNQSEQPSIAPKIMLRLLKLAADHDCEEALGVYVLGLMTESKPINIDAIEVKFNQHHPSLPDVPCYQHDINQYDALVV
ncbi:MAG: IS21 family transposase, partial [Kordiimonadaceae bacterium]|nr:IS21 family transposase [Kordiimonadaceae bacterium]